MAPDASPKKAEPTAQEAYFFLYILKHLKNKPEVDWEAVAKDANFKNGPTANARFRQIKQKLGFGTNASGSDTPKVARSRKKADTPAGNKTAGGRVQKSSTSALKVKKEHGSNDSTNPVPVQKEEAVSKEERDDGMQEPVTAVKTEEEVNQEEDYYDSEEDRERVYYY